MPMPSLPDDTLPFTTRIPKPLAHCFPPFATWTFLHRRHKGAPISCNSLLRSLHMRDLGHGHYYISQNP